MGGARWKRLRLVGVGCSGPPVRQWSELTLSCSAREPVSRVRPEGDRSSGGYRTSVGVS